MERIDMELSPQDEDIEAAIHVARYSVATNLAQGAKVLDIACGTGYGSHLLSKSGASYVLGVDISQDAIQQAKSHFQDETTNFICADATVSSDLINQGPFDLIVSLETIEHVTEPELFLQNLKQLGTENCTFVISCPNDNWYYPDEMSGNPFHLKKYTFDEFASMSTSVLGSNVQWAIGTGVFGFGTVPLDGKPEFNIPNSWIKFQPALGSHLVSGVEPATVSTTNAAYFVGVWNSKIRPSATSVHPVSMETFTEMQASKNGDYKFARDRIVNLEADLEHSNSLSIDIKKSYNELKSIALNLELNKSVLETQVTNLETQVTNLETQVTEMRPLFSFASRFTSFFPRGIKEKIKHKFQK